MSKAFVDTTILADYLLKPATKGKAAKDALSKFDVTELPVYAIKEFKAGPLHAYIWLHNALLKERSLAKTILRIHALCRSLNRNLGLTGLEAVVEAQDYYESVSSAPLIEDYGEAATGPAIQYDLYRLHIRSLVHRAWRKRRKITTRMVYELHCYSEPGLYDNRHGLIQHTTYQCSDRTECALGTQLRNSLAALKTLETVVKQMPESREQRKRYHALHDIVRSPRRPVSRNMCIALGDAIFALLCPNDAIVLTTNLKDHQPLAEALGKKAQRP